MDASQYKPRKKWPLIAGTLVGLLLLIYFVGTSGWFIRAAVLPQIASQLKADLEVAELSLSPFRVLELRRVKLAPQGGEPLLTAELLRVRYGLLAILRGDFRIDEVLLEGPTLSVVEKRNGDSNLKTFLAGLPPGAPEKEKSPDAVQLNLRNLSVKNASARFARETESGGQDISEVSGLNITLDQLGNSQQGKLTLSLKGSSSQGASRLAADGQGEFTLGLDEKLMPAVAQGQVKLAIGAATGAYQEIANAGATLSVDLTMSDLKQLKLAVTRAGESLGTVSLSGPYDLAKKEARISYSVEGIDRRLLDLVGTSSGITFGKTAVTASGRVDLAQFGELIASYGKLNVNELALKQADATSPVLDVALDYKFSVNLGDKTALAEKADLQIRQTGKDLIKGGLDRPMNLAWDRTAPGFREATFTLSLSGLNLSDWRPFVGPAVPAGTVNLTSKITADRDGRLLKLDLSGGVGRLSGNVSGATFDDLGVTFNAVGSLEDFVSATLDRAELIAMKGNERLAKVTAFANQHSQQKTSGIQTSVEVNLPPALSIYPVDGIRFTRGSALVAFQAGMRPGATNLSVNVSASDLDGSLMGAVLTDYQAQIQAAADLTQRTITLQRLTVAAQSGTSPGGSFDMSAKYDPEAKTGTFNFKSVGFNESALGPFVAAAIAPNRLRSISLDGDGDGSLALDGESTLRAGIKISKLVAEDPAGKLPKSPMSLGFKVDASQRAQVLDIRQFRLDLGPTPRAENSLTMKGKLDFSPTNAVASFLKIESPGLDLTPMFNLFAGGESVPATPTEAKTPAGSSQEPPAVVLPLQRFDLDLNVAQVFLREIVVSNWVTRVGVDHNQVTVDPFSLSLNGAPVSAKVKADLGIPGYRYDVQFGATNLPVSPLARTFLSGEQMDLHGHLDASADIRGAGITGRGLKENLAGGIRFSAAGLDYQVTAVRSPLLKSLVAVMTSLLRLPDVSKSPIDAISVNVAAGAGKLAVSDTRVASPAFLAEARGDIALAEELNDSRLNLPVSISVPKSGQMDKLPDFLTVKGTLGKPENDIDKLALVQVAARLPGGLGETASKGLNQLGGAVEKVTGGLIPNVGGLLTGQKEPAKPATNAPAIRNPLDLLRPRKQP